MRVSSTWRKLNRLVICCASACLLALGACGGEEPTEEEKETETTRSKSSFDECAGGRCWPDVVNGGYLPGGGGSDYDPEPATIHIQCDPGAWRVGSDANCQEFCVSKPGCSGANGARYSVLRTFYRNNVKVRERRYYCRCR